MTTSTSVPTKTLWPWRPIYWEPVEGTGERIMVGVLHGFLGSFCAERVIRDEVLGCLFGKAAVGLRNLIDHSLSIYEAASNASGQISALDAPIGGLHPGPVRSTAATSASELIHIACLLYSSLGNLDKLDDADDSDAPQQEEVNKRFSTEVREIIARIRADLVYGFGKSGRLVSGGQLVKFGYFSERAIIHFTVLHSVRHNASARDARARILELQMARDLSGITQTALIAAVPREDDATLGSNQRAQLIRNRVEIEAEADKLNMRWHAVHTATEGAQKLIEVVA